MRKIYDKLVRDRIPEIIEASGKKPVTRVADDGEYKSYLRQKLVEEVEEYMDSGNPEELADIMEVITALGRASGVPFDALLDMADSKRHSRGGFNDKIILLHVDG